MQELRQKEDNKGLWKCRNRERRWKMSVRQKKARRTQTLDASDLNLSKVFRKLSGVVNVRLSGAVTVTSSKCSELSKPRI